MLKSILLSTGVISVVLLIGLACVAVLMVWAAGMACCQLGGWALDAIAEQAEVLE